jgi:ribosomal protein S10
MFFHLKVSSKDNKVLEKFVQFLLKLTTSPIVLKHFSKQKKRKFITVLKSPHINKTAQEQFEFRFYSKQFLINSFKPLTFFLILKKIKNLSFPGIKLEVKGLFDKNKNDKNFLNVINPDNIILKKKRNLKVKKQQYSKPFQKKYIQLFDFYGEICLKGAFYSQNKSL